MPTQIPEQITLQSTLVGDGCVNFQIHSPTSGSPTQTPEETLVTTITAQQLIDGFSLSGSNVHNVYTLVCLDSSGVAQTDYTVGDCDLGSADVDDDQTNLPSISCGSATTYEGTSIFPGIFEVDLGTETGEVEIGFNSYSVPDKLTIEWDGNIVYNSGYVGSRYYQLDLSTSLTSKGLPSETITRHDIPAPIPYDMRHPNAIFNETYTAPGYVTASFNKTSAYPNIAIAKVYAPLGGTAWRFKLECPDEEDVSGNVDDSLVPPPSNGGACLIGDTALTKTCTYQSGEVTKTFTLGENKSAIVRASGTYASGYVSSYAYMNLLDSSNNVIQEFRMYHSQGTSPGSSVFSPSSFKITGSAGGTAFKLSTGPVPSLDCYNGTGTMNLTVDTCADRPNISPGEGILVAVTKSGNVASKIKYVFPGNTINEIQQAINFTKFLRNSTDGVSQNQIYRMFYPSNPDLITALEWEDDNTNTILANVQFDTNSRVLYYNDGQQVVVEMREVSATGTFVAAGSTSDGTWYHKY